MPVPVRKGLQTLRSHGVTEFLSRTLKYLLRTENTKARPSKTYFHELFDRDARQYSRCERTADVATAEMKNADLFSSEVYYGVDISGDRLKRGLEAFDDQTTDFVEEAVSSEELVAHTDAEDQMYAAVHGDMRTDLFPDRSLDLVASTHTLYHLPEEDREQAVQNLCDWLRPNGTLLLQLSDESYTDGLDEILEEQFTHVDVISYRNLFSKLYESFAGKSDGSCTFASADSEFGEILMLFATRCLLPLERSSFTGGDNAYVRCFGRRS